MPKCHISCPKSLLNDQNATQGNSHNSGITQTQTVHFRFQEKFDNVCVNVLWRYIEVAMPFDKVYMDAEQNTRNKEMKQLNQFPPPYTPLRGGVHNIIHIHQHLRVT